MYVWSTKDTANKKTKPAAARAPPIFALDSDSPSAPLVFIHFRMDTTLVTKDILVTKAENTHRKYPS